MLKIAVVLAAALASASVSARCLDVAQVKAIALSGGGTWIELTHDQWEFLRGISAMNPTTPQGLPPGDHAALASRGDGGKVFFEEDDQVCLPMDIPQALIDMLHDVGDGKLTHIGDPT